MFAEREREIYRRYATLRDRAGVSDYAVGKETGVPASTLTEWKNEKYTPKADKLMRIARYFGVSIEDLIGDET